ncbi:MAG: transglutaminase-like domain-containing protein [Coriobacteriales bacterium]|jgi:hypothetical protein|nr:transglutaminase-like domain-containing protein [Coriobacteriales bacterium]
MKRNLKQKILACVLALVLAASTALVGCVKGEIDDRPKQDMSALVTSLRDKYGQEDENELFLGDALVVARDHHFVIEHDFDPFDLDFENFSDISALYYDAELTQYVSSTYDWVGEGHKSYEISPGDHTRNRIFISDGDKDHYLYGSEEESSYVFEKASQDDWGNLGKMYLATFVDLKTGEKLDKPTVQPIIVKGELPVPRLSMEITDDGTVWLKWNEVKGAKEYYILQIRYDKDNKAQLDSANLIGHTSDTKWKSRPQTDNDGKFAINRTFETYDVSEDDWLTTHKGTLEYYEEKHGTNHVVISDERKANRLFCVIAVNEEGMSTYSRMIDVKDIAPLAPSLIARNMERASEDGFTRYIEGDVSKLPAYRWIVMCNGVLSQRLIEYDFDAAAVESHLYGIADDDGNPVDAVRRDVLVVPYVLEGAALSGKVVVEEYDEKNWKAQLEQVKARQDALRSKTGDVRRDITFEEGDDADTSDSTSEGTANDKNKDKPKDDPQGSDKDKPKDKPKDEPQDKDEPKDKPKEEPKKQPEKGNDTQVVVGDIAVTANSALSEYLAINMLSGASVIDLSLFPEARNQDYLIDAWGEAFYQNPLILGVSDVGASYDGKTLYIEYEDDQKSREKKQGEIAKKADTVVAEIITTTMTPREKEFAINQYLCDTVTYDMAALDNAEQYDFMKVDSEFYDSFTAYGALVNGVGVCASYSAAFKVLGDAAGLETVVVTGYLNGSLGHAWNRINLGDGHWVTIDSTNNDVDIVSNALLNVPDSAISTTLVEDTMWIMDDSIAQYTNESDEDEYYRVEGMFFDQDAVVDEIVTQLASKELVVVRTDYRLNDNQFYAIGKKVAEKTGNTGVSGFYWMGVVAFATDPALLR